MTRAPKNPPKAQPNPEEPKPSGPAPSKLQVQFGPSPSAPGSRLKGSKGS